MRTAVVVSAFTVAVLGCSRGSREERPAAADETAVLPASADEASAPPAAREAPAALRTLVAKYDWVSECLCGGRRVYLAGEDGHDAGMYVHDEAGERIAECIHASGIVDEPCGKLENCEVVYRLAPNVEKKPGVNVYGLSPRIRGLP